MTKKDLLLALEQDEPLPDFSIHEKALWLTHHDQWEKTHDLIQSKDDALSSLIHGYLHHVEGDQWNGDYWYRRSGYDLPYNQDEHWNFVVEQVAGR